MRSNDLTDFNMYEQSLTMNVKQPNGAYSERSTISSTQFSSIISYVHMSPNSAALRGILNSEDSVYDVISIKTPVDVNRFTLAGPAKRINVSGEHTHIFVVFTPSENYDGFYYNGTRLEETASDIVTPNDGMVYSADAYITEGTVKISKREQDEFFFSIT